MLGADAGRLRGRATDPSLRSPQFEELTDAIRQEPPRSFARCRLTATLSKEDIAMAKKTSRGRSQDRRLVAGGQDYEVRYEAKKTGKSKAAVKRAIKKVGTSRKKVNKALGK